MGRQKKKRIRNKDFTINDNTGITKGIRMLLIVLAICAVCLIVSAIVNNTKKESATASTIVYNKIIAGCILNREEETYYVLATTSKDTNKDSYNSYVEQYKNSSNAIKIYTVDLDNGFNKSKVTGTDNFFVDSISDLTFKGSALLKVFKGKVIEAYSQDELMDTIQNLSNLDA